MPAASELAGSKLTESRTQTLRTLKIAVVGPVPPPAGGMANQAKALVDSLLRDGAEVRLVAVNAPYKPAFVARIPIVRAIWRLPSYCLALVRAIRKVDVVHLLANSGLSWHLFAVPAIWISVLLRRPIIVNYRGGLAEPFFARQWWNIAPSMRRAARIAVPSQFLVGVFANYGIEAIEVPNIVDFERFEKRSPRAGTQFNVVMTRNLEQIYGIDTGIEAFGRFCQQHPNSKLLIAGSGPLRAQLLEQVNQAGLEQQVEFLGRLGPSEIDELYAKADLLLNPSRVDNSPNSLIEAMAARIPVVTSDAGGIPSMVDDGVHVRMVAVDDVEAMTAALVAAVSDPQTTGRLVEQAYQLVQKYAWTQVGHKLSRLYAAAL